MVALSLQEHRDSRKNSNNSQSEKNVSSIPCKCPDMFAQLQYGTIQHRTVPSFLQTTIIAQTSIANHYPNFSYMISLLYDKFTGLD